MKQAADTRFPPRRQHGAVAVAFIIMSALLFAFVFLATDIGHLYVNKSELQNAADSCALAASAALTGANSNQLVVAESYGMTAGSRNRVDMQRDDIPLVAANITFSQTLGGTYKPRSAIAAADVLKMRYARCTLTKNDVKTLLLRVANLIPGENIAAVSTVAATAVGTLSPSVSNCAMPIAICKTGSAPTYGYTSGQWLQGVLSKSQNMTGAFKWVEFPGFSQNKDLASLIAGQGQCNLAGTNTVQSHNGYIDSMMTNWNTRLGIYRPGGPTVAEAVPDFSGWVYDATQWPAQRNAYPDLIARRAAITPKHQDPASKKDSQTQGRFFLPNPNNWATDAQFQKGGDRRLVVGPIVDCNALSSNGPTAILDWACYMILNPVFDPGDTMMLEYRGLASDPAAGCVTSGSPGGPTAGGPKVPALVQ